MNYLFDYVASGLAFLSLVASILFLSYLLLTEREAPRFAEPASVHSNNPNHANSVLVSIVVAARNEELALGRCLDSLLAQTYPNTEIIVVDDSSKDRTPEIVSNLIRSHENLRLVSAGPKPPGWVGKSWPCWRGYEESKGKYLLFVDADSALSPRTIDLCLNYVIQNRFDMFSLSPKVEIRGIWAKSVLPIISGAINLLYPMKSVNDKKSDRAYVFGTFILVSREAYNSIGGHKSVRAEIVEDAAIAREVKNSGLTLRIERSPELLSTEWESDPKAIFQGIERISSTSIRKYGLASILNAVLLFFVTLYPLLFVTVYAISEPSNSVLEFGLAVSVLNIGVFMTLVGFEANSISGRIGIAPLLYPLGAAFFICAIVTTSIKISAGKGISWKGESYKQST